MVTEWIVTEIDGQIASISARYRHFADIAAKADTIPFRFIFFSFRICFLIIACICYIPLTRKPMISAKCDVCLLTTHL